MKYDLILVYYLLLIYFNINLFILKYNSTRKYHHQKCMNVIIFTLWIKIVILVHLIKIMKYYLTQEI